jgi:hypothetical protein
MNAPSQPAAANWMVTAWPEGSCRYTVLSTHATRDEAVATAARHPGAQLFRAVPAPTLNSKDDF